MKDMTPAAGHNQPPIYDEERLAALHKAVSDYAAEVAVWTKKGVIETAEEAEIITDLKSKGSAIWKGGDNLRKDQKKPHADKGQAVDDAFRTDLSAVTKSRDKLKPLSTAFLMQVAKEQAAAAEKKAEIARKAKEEADRLTAQAEQSDDGMAAAQAEAAQKDAKKLEKEATKASKVKASAGSATGGGRTMALRKVKTAQIDNLNLVYRHFKDHPDLRETLQRLATAAVRSGTTVQGTTLIVTEGAA